MIWHLTKRFVGSLSPRPPSIADEGWARQHLGPGELAIWDRMSNPDRRHAIGVARAVVATLTERADPAADGPSRGEHDGGVDRAIVAAALLHDSGKVESGLGTFARVGATLWWAVADDDLAARWQDHPSAIRRRLARYRLHPELGGEALRQAGADPLTAAWAAEHHRPPESWTVPAAVGAVLKACDDD